MTEFYPQIRALHIAAVLLSIGLFSVRALLVLAGQERIALHRVPRVLSWTLDTLLLLAALALVAILPGAVFGNGWLTAKLLLLVAYVVFATYALRRARSRVARAGFLLAAWATVAFMYGIARTHHPLGWLAGVAG